jgi:hypothetical protein
LILYGREARKQSYIVANRIYLVGKMFAISWASISALDLISCAPSFLIPSEVKAEYRYDAIERTIAIAPISTRTKMFLVFLESLIDTM